MACTVLEVGEHAFVKKIHVWIKIMHYLLYIELYLSQSLSQIAYLCTHLYGGT